MTQPGGLSQASVPEACLLRLSTGAKDAPYNEAAALAVEFSITAEKAALGSLQAFCTFLGKVHETGPFSSWPSKEEREGKSAGCCSLPSETLAREENLDSVEECGQAVAVNFELNLTPFSFPATFCEQFIKETLTFTVVRTPDSSQDGSQRKDAQTKASAKPDGREKGGKKAGPPRPIIPPGESRIAEMPVAALLLLKDGERMQPPEGIQEALATTPALRHLLNPVWFLIKDARHLPLTAQHLQKPRPQDVSDGTIENLASAGVAAAADGAGVAAAADFVPVASAATPTPENRGTSSETQFRGDSTSEAKYPADVPLEYFARAHMLRTVLETEPRRAMPALGANRVRWDAGFLCFWGPSVENQNELKDFIEERRLEIELVNTYDLSGVDQSNLYPDVAAWQCKGKTMGRPLLKQPKTATGSQAKARRATTKTQRSSGGSPETPSNQFLTNRTNASPTGAEPTSFRPPHGVASFCLSSLASCGATRLSFCTDVLPVAGYVARKEGSEIVQLCRIAGPDFMSSGTQLSIEIRLAEPLFQLQNFSTLPELSEHNQLLARLQRVHAAFQEGEAVSSSECISIPLPQQGINRLFFAVPLGSKVAAEAERLEQQEEEQFRYLSHDNNGEAQMKATVMYEAGVDVLTGFLIADGRHLYGIIEGPANGRLTAVAELLLAAAREDGGDNCHILYNSRLRFSDRRYCMADLIETVELKAPLGEIMTPLGLQGKSDSTALLAFSGLSKLQLATLLSRAADLKCQDLFPTSAELRSIRQLCFQ